MTIKTPCEIGASDCRLISWALLDYKGKGQDIVEHDYLHAKPHIREQKIQCHCNKVQPGWCA